LPTYEYRCQDCGEPLEVVQSFTDDALTECPACQGLLKKVFSSPAIAFKGEGFYKNDSRKSAAKSGSSTSDAKNGSGDSGASDGADKDNTSSGSAKDGSSSSTGDSGASKKTADKAGASTSATSD